VRVAEADGAPREGAGFFGADAGAQRQGVPHEWPRCVFPYGMVAVRYLSIDQGFIPRPKFWFRVGIPSLPMEAVNPVPEATIAAPILELGLAAATAIVGRLRTPVGVTAALRSSLR
jgi:hypothetical protein